MMTRDFLSLSLSLFSRVSTKKQRRERERARKKAAFRDAAQRCFKEQRFSLSLSFALRVYKFEEETALLFWGNVFRYLSLSNVFKSDVCIERKKNETKERASAARDARENGGDE